jgi:hypothetical protein
MLVFDDLDLVGVVGRPDGFDFICRVLRTQERI